MQSQSKRLGFGEVAEWSIAAVLKTVDLRGSGGSNPSLSAKANRMIFIIRFFCVLLEQCKLACISEWQNTKKDVPGHIRFAFRRPRGERGGNAGGQIPPSGLNTLFCCNSVLEMVSFRAQNAVLPQIRTENSPFWAHNCPEYNSVLEKVSFRAQNAVLPQIRTGNGLFWAHNCPEYNSVLEMVFFPPQTYCFQQKNQYICAE